MLITLNLSDFNQLGGPCRRVCFKLPFFGPAVGFVVVIYITEQNTAFGAMDNNAYIHVCTD